MDPPSSSSPLRNSSPPRRPSVFRYQHASEPSFTASSVNQAAVPMSILGSDASSAPPPPLPPPANVEELGLPQEPSWPFNNTSWQGFSASGGQDQSAVGRLRLGSVMTADPLDVDRRLSTITAIPVRQALPSFQELARSKSPSEEGSLATGSPSQHLQSERQLGQRSVHSSSRQYDQNLLSKIGGPNTPHRLSSVSSTASDVPSLSPAHSDSRPPFLQRLSMPERRRSSNDSRFSSRNNSATSLFSPASFRSNSIFDPPEVRALAKRSSHSFYDDDMSHRGSHDSNMYMHEESPMEEGPMRELNINDYSPGGSVDYAMGTRAGVKRRASSPRRDLVRIDRASVSSMPGVLEHPRRSIHQLAPRSSPAQRYSLPHNSSVSSASSAGNRTASLASSQGLSVASSITSLGSDRLSPNTLSPLGMDPDFCSPFPTSKSLNPSPRSSVCSTTYTRHSVDASASPASTITPDLHPHTAAVPGVLICDCCPKKPKKFSTEEDLRLHHMEKQYTCLYCPNRFKNKNEAERHQNSLHLRRHSWSCAALPSVEHAFHPSSTNGGATDVCGYCGDEFPNPPSWPMRRNHLNIVHKFGECNQIKKFFRADHFRQHLKHSHAGTSGKWTNILETACMRDEPLPKPMHRPSLGDSGPYGHAGPAAPPQNVMAPPAHKPETINEVPQER